MIENAMEVSNLMENLNCSTENTASVPSTGDSAGKRLPKLELTKFGEQLTAKKMEE